MPAALEGIKVIDLTWVAAGPLVTRCLADFGATVIKIESHTYPDLLRTSPPYKDGIPGFNRSAYWANFNANKYGLSLNLNHPRGIEVAKRFVAWADIVVENFVPGRMKKWGLGYEDLIKIKPDIIMVSLSIQGQTGPYAHLPGFAYNAEALTGFYHVLGWDDRASSRTHGVFTDFLTPRLALCDIMAALDYRRRTGEGQHIDICQCEAGIFFFAPLLLDFFANGRDAGRTGNRSPQAAPHNVYPCHGDERWCALSVSSDEEWQGLRQAMSNPEWAQDARFATFLGRKENEQELDGLISSWTMSFTPEELMTLLQKEGVPAGAVLNNEDLFRDPQLQHREAVWYLEHPEIGRHSYDTFSFKPSLTPGEARMPAPCLGEHTEYVCTQILKMSAEEFAQLFNEGVFD